MSENEFDGLSENEWDDSWDFSWSEFDWERHLRDQDKAIATYLSHYEKLIERPDRIDEIAHQMGWDDESWTNDEGGPIAAAEVEEETPAQESAGATAPREEPESGLDPYTIHKHPVYISTRALFLWLQRAWEFVAPACGPRVPLRTALSFSNGLARAEHHSVLATHSLDMGDFSLAVCQIKRAMTELNTALRHLRSLDEAPHPALAQFGQQALIRVFDIREIWLRVMRDCREELDRRVSEGEN